jgi:hypothetical protein
MVQSASASSLDSVGGVAVASMKMTPASLSANLTL